jgi:hypothetical protein
MDSKGLIDMECSLDLRANYLFLFNLILSAQKLTKPEKKKLN